MPQNVLALITFPNGYYSAVTAALDQVASEVLGHSFQGRTSDIPLHFPDALVREITNDSTMSIKLFFTVVQQPILDEWRNAPLLCAYGGMGGL
jgi:Zn-dependent membrane protease YugP